MSDLNPIRETAEAFKTKVTGPFGTFIFVWGLEHPRTIALMIFDATGSSSTPQAEAKIQKISELLQNESNWQLVGRPLAWTVIAMLAYQIIQLVWHYISEIFRALRQRVSSQQDFKINIFKRFGDNSDDVLNNIKDRMSEVRHALIDFPNVGQGISSINVETTQRLMIEKMNTKSRELSEKLAAAMLMLQLANEDPLQLAFNKFRESKMRAKNPS